MPVLWLVLSKELISLFCPVSSLVSAPGSLIFEKNVMLIRFRHYIMNEQEHNRESTATVDLAYSANLDDKTMHELYMW